MKQLPAPFKPHTSGANDLRNIDPVSVQSDISCLKMKGRRRRQPTQSGDRRRGRFTSSRTSPTEKKIT